jgi:hypothetical protein
MSEDENMDNVGLRKRYRTPIPHAPKKGEEQKQTKSSWGDGQGTFYNFQLELKTKFKDIVFSDEYTDSTTKVTSCTVSDFQSDLRDIVDCEKNGFRFVFNINELVLEHRPDEIMEKIISQKKSRYFYFWVLSMLTLSLLVLVNLEKYNQVLSYFQQIF